MEKSASWGEKRNPANPANLENPDSDKDARLGLGDFCEFAPFDILARSTIIMLKERKP